MDLEGARERNLEGAFGESLLALLSVGSVDREVDDLILSNFIDFERTLRGGGIRGKEDAGVNIFSSSKISHSDHIGLAGEEVDHNRFGEVAGFIIGIRQDHGDGISEGNQGERGDREEKFHEWEMVNLYEQERLAFGRFNIRLRTKSQDDFGTDLGQVL